MYSLRTLAHPSVYCPPRSAPSSSSSTRPHAAPRVVSCSVGAPTVPLVPLKCQPRSDDPGKGWNPAMEQQFVNGRPSEKDGKKEDGGEEEKQGISGIYVPRQKFIPIPKRELLDGILSIFESEEDASEFLRFAKSLDSILHAEHKDILEQMRIYYSLMHAEDEKLNISRSRRLKEFMSIGQHFSPDSSLHASMMEINGRRVDKYEKQQDFYNGLDLQSLFGSSSGGGKTDADKESRVIATCFQHTFMKLLRNAQFEELSAEDLLLTYALNTDYLLTLPIYIDWKRASESNAVIFRRGYATEKQKGFLIIEKLDYLQSKLLQEMLFNISRPLKKLGIWITKALKNASETDELKILIEKLKAWMKGTFPQTPRSYVKGTFSDHLDGAHTEASELPIWLAAQRAAPRYEGFLSSIGPRGRLMRKLLSWIGFIPSMPEAAIELDTDSEVSEAYLRPNFLPRITLADIWKPASRDSCASNVWKMFKTGASILFSRSVLQEPAFQELILLYTDEVTQRESEKVEVMPLQLKIYKGIPYPDLPVIFPHKKLSFRILDTVGNCP
uniref:3-methyl-2-oxobutanoate hydroxymethyltransferase n=1 Tax=Anthurium amnicola TaxID=1678845 RepID=A0A1D1ZFW4_9ARAE